MMALAVAAGTFLVVVAVAPMTSVAPDLEALFAPTGSDRTLQKRISAELRAASTSIRIAMYNLTSATIMKTLVEIKKAKGIDIKLLIDENMSKSVGDRLAPLYEAMRTSGIEIRTVKLSPRSEKEEDTPRFHHKFCVVDNATLITGSYNWTVLADESNHENILIVRDKAIAKTYAGQFDRIWSEFK